MEHEVLKGVDLPVFKDWLRSSDGYDIVDPKYFLKMGFDEEFVKRHTQREYSGEGKYGITVKGKPVEYCDGVYELPFVGDLARRLGADTSHADTLMGRGSSYRALVAAVFAVLNPKATS